MFFPNSSQHIPICDYSKISETGVVFYKKRCSEDNAVERLKRINKINSFSHIN